MGDCYIVRRDGGKSGILGVKVIVAESENTLPNANDGVIAIISDTASEAVYVQNAEPDTPAIGDCWIISGNGEGQQMQIGNVQVNITEAKQYRNGKWENVDGFLRVAGEWVQFSSKILTLMLFDNGEIGDYTWTTVQNGKITHRVDRPGSGTAKTTTSCSPNIDFTIYKTLYLDVASVVRNSTVYYDTSIMGSLNNIGLNAIDVTSIEGIHQLKLEDAISSTASFAQKACEITRVWLTTEAITQNEEEEMRAALNILGVTVDE